MGEMGTENFKLLCSQPSKDVNTGECEIPSFRTNHMMSLLPRTIRDWNRLLDVVVKAPTLDAVNDTD